MLKYIKIILVFIISLFGLDSRCIASNKMQEDIERSLDEIFKITEVGQFATDIGYYFTTKQNYDDDLFYQNFNEEQKTLACIWDLEGEINNGGFDQYYFSSAGNYARFCEKALENIGSKELLAILKEANSSFPDGKPDPIREKRWKQMDQWGDSVSDHLNKLDNRYYENLNENVSQLVYDYAHKFKKELYEEIN